MSRVFKVLASISIWALFISGLGGILWTTIEYAINPAEAYNFADVTWLTISTLSLFLGVVAIKIRKSLD
ncbi:MAG: hypothetical protein ACXWFB_07820 [Nitrososphaeraceae archaeon]